jgi:hypothetical protein
MFSVFWPTQGARRNLIGQPTFLLDRQITNRWDAFIEYAGDFPQRGTPQHLLHLGTALKITSNQQLDEYSEMIFFEVADLASLMANTETSALPYS